MRGLSRAALYHSLIRRGLLWLHTDQDLLCLDFHIKELRTVPTIVTAHTSCASCDNQVFYGWWLLIQGYFCMV